MSAFKTSLHPGRSLQESRLLAMSRPPTPPGRPASSVALRPLLVLGPNGLAVLQGHFFIVTPVIKETTFDTSLLWTALDFSPPH